MVFRIEISQGDLDRSVYRASLKIGETLLYSVPQDLPTIFRDVLANVRFISERRLANVFFSEEPLATLRYKGDVIEAYVFRRSGVGSEKLSAEAVVGEILQPLNKFLDDFEHLLGKSGTSRLELDEQVRSDASLGIYNPFLLN